MANITFREIENEVRRLVDNDPNFVYPKGPSDKAAADNVSNFVGCFYNGKYNIEGKACIFGQALTNLGFRFEKRHEGKPVQAIVAEAGIEFTDTQELWMSEVQRYQDWRDAWSLALAKADKTVVERAMRGN